MFTVTVFNAIQYIGALPALLFASQVTDYFGRRRAIAFGSCIMLAGVALQSASKEVGMFVGLPSPFHGTLRLT